MPIVRFLPKIDPSPCYSTRIATSCSPTVVGWPMLRRQRVASFDAKTHAPFHPARAPIKSCPVIARSFYPFARLNSLRLFWIDRLVSILRSVRRHEALSRGPSTLVRRRMEGALPGFSRISSRRGYRRGCARRFHVGGLRAGTLVSAATNLASQSQVLR